MMDSLLHKGKIQKATRCLEGLNNTVETDMLESKEVGHSACVHSLYCQYARLCFLQGKWLLERYLGTRASCCQTTSSVSLRGGV